MVGIMHTEIRPCGHTGRSKNSVVSWGLWFLPRDKSQRHGPVASLVSEHQARPIGMEPGREENPMSMTAEKPFD